MSLLAPVLDNPERLEALRRTGLLDSPPEELFDRLARMAAKVLEVPVAIITFVDDTRQFFKSCVGLPEPWHTYRETPLSHSFCQYVTAGGKPLVVEDARLDERLRDNLAIKELHAIAYLGVPLKTRTGFTLGSFAAIDSEPHLWTERDVSLMKDLAALVMAQIELPAEQEARRKAEEALERSREDLRVAVEAGGIGVWSLDLETDDITCTERCMVLLGLPPGETLTLARFLTTLHPDDREPTDVKIRQSLAERKDFTVEYRTVWPDGSVHWIYAQGRGIDDPSTGEPHRFTGAMLEITARKISEEELRESKETAEAANRTKDDFLAALSHELRTPLNPVLMIASELENSPEVSERLREDFALIRKNVELEARLIDDLLDLTRVLRGKLQLNVQHTDLHISLRQAVGILQTDSQEKQLRLQLDLAAIRTTVSADAARLQQIFWNVLKNAIKFTPLQGKIWIRTRNIPGNLIRVEIADTGIGIEPGDEEQIFQAFVQSPKIPGHRFGGLGLGLSISRLLAEMHHGRIWAKSAGHNAGSTFFIELPLVTTPEEPRPTETGPAHGSTTKLRILLVEDHEQTRKTLERLLGRRGHQVTAAATLAEGRKLAAGDSFDLLLSDLGLPDGSGEELMKEVRETKHLKGIALSGYGMEEDIQRSLEAGFAAHLTKPINIEALDQAIERTWRENG